MRLSAATPYLAIAAGEVSLFHRRPADPAPGSLYFLACLRGPCLVPLQLVREIATLEIRGSGDARFALHASPDETDAAGLGAAADQLFAGIESPLPAGGLQAVRPGERLAPPLPAGVFAADDGVVLQFNAALQLAVLGHAGGRSGADLLYLPKRAWAGLATVDGTVEPVIRLHSLRELAPPERAAAAGEWVARLVALTLDQAVVSEQREHAGVTARHDASQHALRAGTGLLLAALDRQHASAPPQSADPLADQLGVLWQRQGIAARPATVAAPGGALQRAGVVAESSGVRSRTVALKGGWWREDCGALLGQWESDQSPVALVWEGRGYRARLADGTWRPVDEEVAAGLAGFALVFYRALPAGQVTAWGLVRHAFSGRTRPLIRIVGLSLALAALGLLTPIITSQLVDFAIPSAEGGLVLVLVAGLALAGAVAIAFQFAQSLLVLGLETRVNQEMECAVWDRLLRLPTDFFKGYTLGDLAQRAGSINRIRSALSGKVLGGALAGVFAGANFAVLFAFSPGAAGVALLLAIPVVAALAGFTLISTRWQRQLLESEAEASSLTFELLSAIAKIRTTASEAFALRRWAGAYGVVRRQALRLQLFETGAGTGVVFYGNVSQAVLYAVAGGLLLRAAGDSSTAALTSGQFIGFMAAFAAFLQGLGSLARSVAELNAVKPLYDRVTPLLHAEVESAGQPGPVPELRGAIDLVALSFGYTKEAPVLEDINLSIRPGEFVALVGPSGSGKSTLLRLLLGFEQPDSGEVRYDGVALRDLDLRSLRMRFGVVLQHGMLVPSDIFSNIRGVTGATMEECWAAAEAVALADEIRAMPMGLMTMISEGASTISGGQRQRILLARALVRKPRIVFLDEATSALDNISQAAVTASLGRLAATRIVVAHRLSTIRQADRIIVLDGGRIVESGRYDELMAQRGAFHRLAARQTVEA